VSIPSVNSTRGILGLVERVKDFTNGIFISNLFVKSFVERFFPFYQSTLYFCIKNPKENLNFLKFLVFLDITHTFKRHYLIFFLAITVKITINFFTLTEGKKRHVKILHSFLLMFVKSCDVGLLDEMLHKTRHRHLSP
jgi:hypothetical protein